MKLKRRAPSRRQSSESNRSSVPEGSARSIPASAAERWRGKVALVTGASSGIGAAIAVMLGELGLKVALAGRDRRRLGVVAERVRTAGGDGLVAAGDQARMPGNAAIFQRVRQRWGEVDVLVNCAGMRGGISLLDDPWPELQAALDLNVSSALWCAREAVAGMQGKTEGAIVNISSMVGHRVFPGVPAMYAATKHALRILTDGLRAEVSVRRLPIKVALISPGLTDTPWHRQQGSVRAGGKNYPHAPLTPRDVADTVRYVLETPPGVQIRDILLCSSEQPY
jgi:NADP-dependent 3-hydroxy acid dehydrogenase YdfG